LDFVELVRGAVAAEEVREILREGGARNHHVATGFHRLQLQVALHVRHESDDRGFLLQFLLELRYRLQRLGGKIVEVEDDERRLLTITVAVGDAIENVFVSLDELDFDVELAAGLLNLGEEEQVLDEAEDAGLAMLVIGGQRLQFHGLVGRRQSAAAALLLSALAVAIVVVHRRGEDAAGIVALLVGLVTLLSLVLSGTGTGSAASTTTAMLAAPAATATGVLRSKSHGALYVPGVIRRRDRTLAPRIGSGANSCLN